ncbi:PQQ-dependent sugar dehydrogenase [Pseudoalteromonas sp. CST5]|uniref:PQQ-dependent sugar dehydrogenase n=1 Tax=unclassified Pseudoalteromonas TaxID=194690 RepID=UPI002359FE9F|nr:MULTISPECIES: PQQ-dependent sugar dehydrogenase [unclassified Pseudoalteromonas]MDC9512058.1 PQQ-dependent sugar dehydrogenase [Pseudoalteromonas sp. CST1]MDC9536294.1 PQQ-dependent sugar dehydrogenase [Pseudoalteromonas sp. CST3]MDC9540343.1 PQQ-dependent sugar dehydrogenase [Pseudoalteromonas sp. CST2]MDC9546782.1 PQQ-dependent sugar dehydrogenase [Pseudoalteromonas sp. CST4]MDC9551222.1 PQQ-dependent sugar dehydrogenase [Pseudoalteromonas sp. CST5]
MTAFIPTKTIAKTLSTAFIAVLVSTPVAAVDYKTLDVLPLNVKAVSVAKGVTIPWAIEPLSNGDLLITERSGTLYLLPKNSANLTKLSGLPQIDANGQGGLLDLALHSGPDDSQWLYITYSSTQGAKSGSNTALMRAKLSDDRTELLNTQLLYKGEHNSTKGQHYGSRIVFDNQGYVYFSIGDRGSRDKNPQDLTRDGGKIYRLHTDGRIPKDNPFVNQKSAKHAIWSYGHRNPQGMWFDKTTQTLWSHEHGPRGGDELNIIKAGANYGWPVVSYGVNYSGTSFTDIQEKDGMQSPVLHWTPSIAPSDMLLVSSDKYPQLKGKLLLSSMKFSFLSALEISNKGVSKQYKILEGIGRVRSLAQGSDGYIYLGIDGQGIKRLEPEQ